MSPAPACAACANPAGPFDCVHHGQPIRLCSTCAERLLAGESKAAVLHTNQSKSKEAA